MLSGWIPSSKTNGSHEKHMLSKALDTDCLLFPKNPHTHTSASSGHGSFHPQFAHCWDGFSPGESCVCNSCLSSAAALQCNTPPWFLFPKLTTIQETQGPGPRDSQSLLLCMWTSLRGQSDPLLGPCRTVPRTSPTPAGICARKGRP